MKWFKHKSDASDDEFLSGLEANFGLEGYARWWKMLEVIAKQMDETDRCSAEYSWVDWQRFLKGKRNKLETFLVHCENKRKINLEQNGNILKIICPKLLELRDEHTRKIRSKAGLSREQDTDTDIDTEECYKNAHEAAIPKTAFEIVYDEGCKLFPNLAPANTSPIHTWLNSGCHPELDCLPVLRRSSGKNITSWTYFTNAMADAKATRLAPMPEGKPYANQQPLRSSPYANKTQRLEAAVRSAAEAGGFASKPSRQGEISSDDHAMLPNP